MSSEKTILYRPIGAKELKLTVGGSIHQEFWIPAEELAEFNRNIVGKIEVITRFYSETN